MAIKKEKLLDKLVKRDYNNDLEEVLAKKTFKEEVKNLLLDILYKIEISYKDYETVKKNVLSKEEYIETIIKSVKNRCESIQFIKPNNAKKRSLLVNKEKKEIICYPMERKLLYAIAKIKKDDNIIAKEPKILKKALTNTINIGNNINMVEPLRDFNGFAWSISVLDMENFYYNLIYQDLNLLIGNKLLDEWANNYNKTINYMALFRDELEKNYGKKFAKEVLNLFKVLSILLELNVNESFKKEILRRKQKVEVELNNMDNVENYLENMSKDKKNLLKQMREIDLILNNKEKLSKEYIKINKDLPLEQKVFSQRVFKKNLEQEKNELMSRIRRYNEKMNSKKFLKTKKELKYEQKYLKVANVKNLENYTFESIILFQEKILQALKTKIEKATTKEEINKILYEIRYFNLIPIDANRSISQIPQLYKILQDTKKCAIVKAYELKEFNEISRSMELNMDILEHIFSLKIIKLEDIYLKLVKEENNIYVQFFDDDIVDEKFKLNFYFEENNLKLKFNKKIKLISKGTKI